MFFPSQLDDEQVEIVLQALNVLSQVVQLNKEMPICEKEDILDKIKGIELELMLE